MMKLNPNLVERKKIAKKIQLNNGYCPCLVEKNEDTKCPCKYKREQEDCICELYVKVEE